jgi:formylglycine-generating enzyme
MRTSRRASALFVTLLALLLGLGGGHPVANAEPEQPAATSCPKEMATVANFCIDRYEAHLLVRQADGSLKHHAGHARPTDGEFVARSEPGVKPQGYISRNEAQLACENAGKRLCSVSEWFGACRGNAQTTYPYGAKYEKGRCNVGKPHLLSQLFGKDPKAWRYDEHFNAPELLRRPGFLANSGEYAGCASSNGTHDMVGNLHEWVSDRVDPTLAEKLPLTDGIRRKLRSNTGKGIFMGGFFSTTDQHGQGCNFVTTAHEPRYHDYSTGFRCCRSQ